MKTVFTKVFVMALLFVSVPNSIMAVRIDKGDFYVAPDGRDDNVGTKDQPFATLLRAQKAVREKVKAGLNKPIIVLIRGGTYEIQEPLVFGPEDSGTTEYCITYAAEPGARPLISGGRIIKNWKKGRSNLWTTQIPDVKKGKWRFRQLYADGTRLGRGRYPEKGLLRITKVADGVKTLEFDKKLPQSLGDRDAELVVIQNWSIARSLILSSQAKTVHCATPLGWVGHGIWTTASPGKPAYLENALEFLRRPGQWHLDRKTGTLTYLAADNENPADKRFIAPMLEQLLVINGTSEKPVRNLCFQGLTFAYAAWQLPPGGYAGIQAGYNATSKIPDDAPEETLPTAVNLMYARDCAFELCRFVHIGPSAIGLSAGTQRNRILACEIADVGGNGIHIGLPKGPIPVLDLDWKDPHDVPTGNEVSNCYVHHCAAESFGCVGIFAAFSANTRISHNYVSFAPYTGISIGFRWNTTPTSQKNCLVEYNHIHDVMMKIADGGGIYTLGLQPGTILRGNHIYNVHRASYAHGGAPNNGIFFDEGSMDFLVEDNVIHSTSGKAIRFNENKKEWHTWRNNSFDVKPDDPRFPRQAAARAGLQEPYKNLVMKMSKTK